MIQNTFPVPPVSAYEWNLEKLKKNHTFFLTEWCFFEFFFFFSRNNQTQEILYSIFISKSWGPTCCSCGCDSFDEWEKRLGYSSFQSTSDDHSCSGLGFPLTSYNKSQNNTSTFQLSGLARVFEYTVYRGFLNRVYGIYCSLNTGIRYITFFECQV